MKILEQILSWSNFILLLFVLVMAPWFFGAWEMWYFWPFTAIIFSALSLFAIRLIFFPDKLNNIGRFSLFNGIWLTLTAFGIFLIYAAIRFLQAEVFMNAERSFMLFFTPFLISINIIFGLNNKQRQILWSVLFIDLIALGLYGLINHFITGDKLVMWREGYKQYYKEHRATGSYFCPDHFSGIMELALCMAIPLIIDIRSSVKWRIISIIAMLIASAGIILSISRGGGATMLVIIISAIIFGGTQFPKQVRVNLKIATILLGIALVLIISTTESKYINRFKRYFGKHSQASSISEKAEIIKTTLMKTSRGRMYGGAVRAWQTHPVSGIGPGMHQNLWFHFAPTDDGNKEENIWPSQTNHYFHSYEVHSDWLQLLEEYGIIGLILFLIPCFIWFNELRKRLPDETMTSSHISYKPLYAAPFAGLLAIICMSFHSLGDFNLQMPATVWLLSALISLPVTDKDIPL